jgi:hypothetical protein
MIAAHAQSLALADLQRTVRDLETRIAELEREQQEPRTLIPRCEVCSAAGCSYTPAVGTCEGCCRHLCEAHFALPACSQRSDGRHKARS